MQRPSFLFRYPNLVISFAAASLLGIAYLFQALGYAPCELCWWQRYPYMTVVPIGLLGAVFRDRLKILCLALCTLLLMADFGIAVFHVGVENLWWEGLETCSGAVDLSGLTADEILSLMQTDIPRCDEAAWSLFKISMAGWNAIAAGLASGYALSATLDKSRRHNADR